MFNSWDKIDVLTEQGAEFHVDDSKYKLGILQDHMDNNNVAMDFLVADTPSGNLYQFETVTSNGPLVHVRPELTVSTPTG